MDNLSYEEFVQSLEAFYFSANKNLKSYPEMVRADLLEYLKEEWQLHELCDLYKKLTKFYSWKYMIGPDKAVIDEMAKKKDMGPYNLRNRNPHIKKIEQPKPTPEEMEDAAVYIAKAKVQPPQNKELPRQNAEVKKHNKTITDPEVIKSREEKRELLIKQGKGME